MRVWLDRPGFRGRRMVPALPKGRPVVHDGLPDRTVSVWRLAVRQERIQPAGSWKCQMTSDGRPPAARAADGR